MTRFGFASSRSTSPRLRLPLGPELRHAASLVLRVAAAVGGGYAIAGLATVALSLCLPMARSEAVLAATMSSFAVYATAVVWAFAARDAWRAWLGMAGAAALLLLLVLLLQGHFP